MTRGRIVSFVTVVGCGGVCRSGDTGRSLPMTSLYRGDGRPPPYPEYDSYCYTISRQQRIAGRLMRMAR